MIKTILFSVLSASLLLSVGQTFASEDSQGGLGLEIQNLGGATSILADLPGTPSASSGLQSGDVIVAVQSTPNTALTPIFGMSLNEVVGLIRGAAGTPVTLDIVRGQQGMSFTLVRAVIVEEHD